MILYNSHKKNGTVTKYSAVLFVGFSNCFRRFEHIFPRGYNFGIKNMNSKLYRILLRICRPGGGKQALQQAHELLRLGGEQLPLALDPADADLNAGVAHGDGADAVLGEVPKRMTSVWRSRARMAALSLT